MSLNQITAKKSDLQNLAACDVSKNMKYVALMNLCVKYYQQTFMCIRRTYWTLREPLSELRNVIYKTVSKNMKYAVVLFGR